MIEVIRTREDVHAKVRGWRGAGETVALVPTMGALHEGHLALVREARSTAGRVIASIFVNPTQFGPNEDFSRYPRPIERDTELLEKAGAHALFLPDVDTMYPAGNETRITQLKLPQYLCGAFRPGHFEGVLTIVAKLFNQVRPDVALFGQKDFQQTVVLRRMLRDLDFDLDLSIRVCPTVREPDGLAMSSRNAYLMPEERAKAPMIKRSLDHVVARFRRGETRALTLAGEARDLLVGSGGFDVQYLTIADPQTLLTRADVAQTGDLVAVAAYLGRTRLIDNVLLP